MQTTVTWLLAAAALWLVAFWIIVSVAGAIPILKLARFDLEAADEAKACEVLQTVLETKVVDSSWLAETGFELRGVFRVTGGLIGAPYVVVWQYGKNRTYLCIYVLSRLPMGMNRRVPAGAITNFPIETNFATVFPNGMLSTGRNRDGQLLPPRSGRLIQTFSVTDPKELWGFHQAGLKFLREANGQVADKATVDFREDFVSNIRAHMAYIRSLPLWFLRIPYWYLVRRFSMHNKSVREQCDQLYQSKTVDH
jgi:hypothetical protein